MTIAGGRYVDRFERRDGRWAIAVRKFDAAGYDDDVAVGIGLVFGVMRLVNFAYGQLIMAGAFALAFASERDWPVGIGIVLCFAVVLALTSQSILTILRRATRRASFTPLLAQE